MPSGGLHVSDEVKASEFVLVLTVLPVGQVVDLVVAVFGQSQVVRQFILEKLKLTVALA